MDKQIRRNRLDDAKRRGVRIVHVQSPHVRHPGGQSHADQRLHLIGGVDPDTPDVDEEASLLREQHERAHRHTERPRRVRHEYLATTPRGNLERRQVTRRALGLKRHAVRGEAEHPERLRRVRVKHGEVRVRDGTQRLVPEVDLNGLDGDRGRPVRSGLEVLVVHLDALFDVIARARRARRRPRSRAPHLIVVHFPPELLARLGVRGEGVHGLRWIGFERGREPAVSASFEFRRGSIARGRRRDRPPGRGVRRRREEGGKTTICRLVGVSRRAASHLETLPHDLRRQRPPLGFLRGRRVRSVSLRSLAGVGTRADARATRATRATVSTTAAKDALAAITRKNSRLGAHRRVQRRVQLRRADADEHQRQRRRHPSRSTTPHSDVPGLFRARSRPTARAPLQWRQ